MWKQGLVPSERPAGINLYFLVACWSWRTDLQGPAVYTWEPKRQMSNAVRPIHELAQGWGYQEGISLGQGGECPELLGDVLPPIGLEG